VASEVADRRVFFVPAKAGGWDLVEATKGEAGGWEVRRPGRIGFDAYPDVPPPGEDWVEAHEPKRAPHVAKPTAPKPAPPAAKPSEPKARVLTRPPPPRSKAREEAEPKAMPRKAVPGLSQELEDLLLREQRSQPVPAGKVQCPVCGVILDPMKAKKVRTHDNPITGARCVASGRPWADFKR